MPRYYKHRPLVSAVGGCAATAGVTKNSCASVGRNQFADSAATKKYVATIGAAIFAIALGGCAREPNAGATPAASPSNSLAPADYHDIINGAATSTFSSKPTASGEASRPPDMSRRAEIYDGAGMNPQRLVESESKPLVVPVAYADKEGVTSVEGNAVQVNFENADISAVARAILGDVLNANYTIDPRVKGTISLSTRRPVPRNQLLWLLETALRAQGSLIVQQGVVYRILPAGEANAVGDVNVGPEVGAPGYGISALPLQNISVEVLNKILDGFGAPPGSVHVDPARNLLIVRGTAGERQWVIDTALAFDVDWMRNQAVGVFPVQRSGPEVIINELNQLADPSVVRFQPITRMNAILAVSKSRQAIHQVSTWIGRLDQDNGYGPSAHVYRLKHSDVRKVVAVIKETFLAGSQSAGGDQIAPGGGIASDKSGATLAAAASAEVRKSSDGAPNSRGGDSGGGANGEGATIGGSKMRITADLSNNAIVVYATAQEYKSVERTIIELDRSSTQVAVEAIVAEVTLNDTLNYGVQYYLQNSAVNSTGSIAQLSAALPIAQTVPGFNLLLGSIQTPKVVLSALRDVTDVKVLSSPSLVVVDNQPAILQVGDQVPVTTAQSVQTVTTGAPIVNAVSYVDTGVILRVTPHIGRGSQVRLDIEQEVSNVAQNANATTLTPTISQRKVKSTVEVDNGQTVMLAGLISQQRNMEKSGLPGMIDVPLLGNILTNSNRSGQRTELIVFVRPKVIRNNADAQQAADELRGRMPGFRNW
jgi:general secretion pathway protein D